VVAVAYPGQAVAWLVCATVFLRAAGGRVRTRDGAAAESQLASRRIRWMAWDGRVSGDLGVRLKIVSVDNVKGTLRVRTALAKIGWHGVGTCNLGRRAVRAVGNDPVGLVPERAILTVERGEHGALEEEVRGFVLVHRLR